MPDQKDTIAAFLGASAALAGLLLVFIGFVYARGESYTTRRGDPFKLAAKIGVAPFLCSLACTGFAGEWLLGAKWAYDWTVYSFRGSLILTAIYGVVTLLFLL